MSLAAQVLNACIERNFTLTTAESCTGGMLMAALTDVVGSSAVMDRGFVAYSNAAKVQMLAVDAAIISKFGAVSKEVVCAMADGALANSQADIALSVTGVAGPSASKVKPEGMVYFAVAQKNNETISRLCQFGPLGRLNVRRKAVETALQIVLTAISTTKP